MFSGMFSVWCGVVKGLSASTHIYIYIYMGAEVFRYVFGVVRGGQGAVGQGQAGPGHRKALFYMFGQKQ